MNLILTHEHTDFDALAALVAATKIYPDSSAILPSNLNANVREFVNLYRELLPLKTPGEIGHDPALVVIVDTRRRGRLERYAAILEKASEIHIFDHHPPGEDDLEAAELKVEDVGAVTTLLVEEIRRRDLAMTELEASLLALGIYEDTGSLTYNSTTPRDMEAAAYLWKKGLQPAILQQFLHTPLTVAQKGLLERLIAGSEFYELRRRRILISSATTEEYVQGVAVLARYLQDTEDIELAVIMVSMDNGIYITARALSDDLDLPSLLAPMEAKGQRAAVSALLKSGDLAEARDRVLELLENYMPPGATAGQVASSPVITVDGEQSVEQVMKMLADQGFGGCPVTEDGKITGMISRRDLQKALRHGLGHAPVKGFMKRHVTVASPDDSATTLRRIMVEQNIGRVPLVSDGGELTGIVTRSDILRALYNLDRRGRAVNSDTSLIRPRKPERLTGLDNLLPLINELPGRVQSLLLTIGRQAEKSGYFVCLVGGVIRDLLMGCDLPQDLDLVVIPDAVAFSRELNVLLGGKLTVFEQFGTASVYLEGNLRLDLATARKEFYAAPAALPQVEETTTLKTDLYRRDFTINTLACSLLPGSFGRLYDFFSGRSDLQSGVIRTLYNLSFVDDPLRILRAARFEQRFGFTIDEVTLDLIGKAVRSKVLEKVSRQRLNNEIALVYREPDPVRVLKRLDQFGLLPFIYPRIRIDYRTWQRLNRIQEAFGWASRRDWKTPPAPDLVYLAGLIYNLESDERSVIMRKLHFSRERSNAVLSACREVPLALVELSQEGLRRSELVNRLEPLPPEALLLAYALGGGRVRDYIGLYLDSLQHVRPRLRGGDLRELGLEPGPLYREVLASLHEAVLDGKVRTPVEEKDYILNFLKQPGTALEEEL